MNRSPESGPRRAAGLLLTLFLLFGLPEAGPAFDRDDFGSLLRMMPPNGPPEHYGNVIMRDRAVAKGMAPVVFSHWSHRTRYTCKVCHVELGFGMPRGTSGISRGGNLAGRHCGACHNGTIAFSVRYEQPKHCDRCHQADTKGQDDAFKKLAARLPRTSSGNRIDWVEALNRGLINPKTALLDTEPAMGLPAALEKPLHLGTSEPRSAAIFAHRTHVDRLDCANCHPDIFNIQQKGTVAFSMDKNMYGWFCGTCHLRVAFPMTDCHRCHPGMKSGNRGF